MIPEGWTHAELGTLADFTSGGTPSKQRDDFWGGTFPWVSAKDLKKHVVDSAELGLTDAGKREANTAPVGAVLVLVRGMTLLKDVPIGYVAKPVAFNQDIKALIAKGHVDPKFLAYLLVSLKRPLMSLVNTANHGTGRLDTDLLKSLPVLLPPIQEQRRIASRLETWDRAIETVEALIANARAQKQALMQQLLPQGTTPPKSRLPGFSGEWREAKLGLLADISKGEQKGRASLADEGPVPVINGGITPSGYTDHPNTAANTITISEGGNSCGHVDLITQPFWCGGHCYALKNLKVDRDYLFAVLKHRQSEIMSLRVGSGLPNIQKKALSQFSIPVPARPEQEKIGELAASADKEIAALEAQLSALRQEKAALMQQLLTGKRRVKLPESEVA